MMAVKCGGMGGRKKAYTWKNTADVEIHMNNTQTLFCGQNYDQSVKARKYSLFKGEIYCQPHVININIHILSTNCGKAGLRLINYADIQKTYYPSCPLIFKKSPLTASEVNYII